MDTFDRPAAGIQRVKRSFWLIFSMHVVFILLSVLFIFRGESFAWITAILSLFQALLCLYIINGIEKVGLAAYQRFDDGISERLLTAASIVAVIGFLIIAAILHLDLSEVRTIVSLVISLMYVQSSVSLLRICFCFFLYIRGTSKKWHDDAAATKKKENCLPKITPRQWSSSPSHPSFLLPCGCSPKNFSIVTGLLAIMVNFYAQSYRTTASANLIPTATYRVVEPPRCFTNCRTALA